MTTETSTRTEPEVFAANLPLLPLRDVVVFPHYVMPLYVGRERSIRAIETALENNKQIALVTQKNAKEDDPQQSDLFEVGCAASLLQVLKLPDGTIKVLVEGKQRMQIESIEENDGVLMAQVTTPTFDETLNHELEAMRRSAVSQFEQFLKLNNKIPPEILASVAEIEEPGKLSDTIIAHLPVKLAAKQKVLELVDIKDRLEYLLGILESEIDIMQVEKRVRGRVKRQMEKSQREYYLNEQVKAIQKELGEGDGGADIEEIEKAIKAAAMSKEALKKAQSELKKLKMTSPMSAEATVVRNYLETLTDLPWKKRTRISKDLQEACRILDEDHYGLGKVKDRIVEYLAVQQRVQKMKGSILCLVGPPGVGKTSLGESIARATNRKYVRFALGGVRDEAEIRGHRRTYIGSMPGKILQNMTKSGVKNPLFLLDEVDKINQDFRGDPASALLEVLDPEQNSKFSDHYVEVDYDLSEVMFVATANSLNIPPALLDRMEVIRLEGYTENEKIHIALNHLVAKQISYNGLKEEEVAFTEGAIRAIVRYYTREAGVRNLEREIAKICRKLVKEIITGERTEKLTVEENDLEKYLGVQKHRFGYLQNENRLGQVTGLAWTEVGGELLSIEAVHVRGKGNIVKTGKLGDVMQESIQAALSVVRSRANQLGISHNRFRDSDFHIHFPEGAIPKDGPSAGIGIVTALVSSLTHIPVKADVAMTGEITLRGEILAIGGLKEKLLAAVRGCIKKVLIPEENVKNLADVPDDIKNHVEIIPVKWLDQVFEHALCSLPEPLPENYEQEASKVNGEQSTSDGLLKNPDGVSWQ